jgi:hypothetical protein
MHSSTKHRRGRERAGIRRLPLPGRATHHQCRWRLAPQRDWNALSSAFFTPYTVANELNNSNCLFDNIYFIFGVSSACIWLDRMDPLQGAKWC